jgi:hypothetical protein
MPSPPPADPPAGAAVTHCPGCGAALTGPAAFVQEFWSAAERNFVCWCPGCGLMCTVMIADRLLGYEPAH